jgi:hypothetical protein
VNIIESHRFVKKNVGQQKYNDGIFKKSEGYGGQCPPMSAGAD